MKFYTGSPHGPIVTRGEHQTRMLDFALQYQGWHSIGKDKRTVRALNSLVRMRVIEHSPETEQFRFRDTRGVSMKPFTFVQWHAWQGASEILLSEEGTKTLRSFPDVDACVNWLFLSGFKPAARALNSHAKQ